MVLGIAAGAVLCGMRGYQAISDWAQSLGQKSRERFGCRREEGRYVVPSEYVLRIPHRDRKSTRLNSSHLGISYAVFCLKKKKHLHTRDETAGQLVERVEIRRVEGE